VALDAAATCAFHLVTSFLAAVSAAALAAAAHDDATDAPPAASAVASAVASAAPPPPPPDAPEWPRSKEARADQQLLVQTLAADPSLLCAACASIERPRLLQAAMAALSLLAHRRPSAGAVAGASGLGMAVEAEAAGLADASLRLLGCALGPGAAAVDAYARHDAPARHDASARHDAHAAASAVEPAAIDLLSWLRAPTTAPWLRAVLLGAAADEVRSQTAEAL